MPSLFGYRGALAFSAVFAMNSFFSEHPGAEAKSYKVSPDGRDGYYTLDEALELVEPGEYIHLTDGTYTGGLKPLGGGKKGSPIKIYGDRDAIITGKNPVVHIEHSWITLKEVSSDPLLVSSRHLAAVCALLIPQGFTVNGKYGDKDVYDSYLNKCVWVKGQGTSTNSALKGFVMNEMKVHNCGGECVRLRNFVVEAEVRDNEISDCGVYDFRFGSSGKNGEAIYIGTASELWDDDIEDQCLDNLITGNVMKTNGNECVDIKEGASGNLIEHNECSNQLDDQSGCYDSRGDDNTFRYNKATDCVGAGVRLGGDTVKGYTYGTGNSVYENTFKRSEAGGINLQVSPQSNTCGNDCYDGPCDLIGSEDGTIESTWDQPC